MVVTYGCVGPDRKTINGWISRGRKPEEEIVLNLAGKPDGFYHVRKSDRPADEDFEARVEKGIVVSVVLNHY